MKDLIKYIPVFLELWFGLSIVGTVIFCAIANNLKEKHDKYYEEYKPIKSKEFKDRKDTMQDL
jgi:hypothetical protein